MANDEPTTLVNPGPGLDRVITLTDAVVAIAMTLLVLPVVDAATEVESNHVGEVLQANSDQLVSFAISFLVIYVFWSVHAGALRHLEETGTELAGLRPLNMLWLLVIAFLPFPTALVGHRTDTASVPIYIGTMFLLSALTATIVTLAHRGSGSRLPHWGWWTTAVFAACTLVGVVNADAGLYALLALAVLRAVESRVRPGR